MVADAYILGIEPGDVRPSPRGGNSMKVWSKPAVREQEVGLEVTSYLPAEIDII
jgi:coenzyme PQQ precursor peptide PqqA